METECRCTHRHRSGYDPIGAVTFRVSAGNSELFDGEGAGGDSARRAIDIYWTESETSAAITMCINNSTVNLPCAPRSPACRIRGSLETVATRSVFAPFAAHLNQSGSSRSRAQEEFERDRDQWRRRIRGAPHLVVDFNVEGGYMSRLIRRSAATGIMLADFAPSVTKMTQGKNNCSEGGR